MTILQRVFFLLLIAGLAALCFSVSAGPLEDAESAYRDRDYPRALALLEPLANQGDSRAQAMLGSMYSNGYGVRRDARRAEGLLRKAADQNNAQAQSMLGMMYYLGFDLPQNLQEAAALLQRAAEHGNATAQINLASMYATGSGVTRDPARAVFWYEKAAEQGNPAAQYSLGVTYDLDKSGVPKNHALSVSWYRRAAEQGYSTAQFSLAEKYLKGEGVPQDYFEAYKWLVISLEYIGVYHLDSIAKHLALEARSSIVSKLTSDQVERAERLAKAWKPSPENIKN